MDAEQMLDQFADIVETMVRQRMSKTDGAMFEYTESHEEMKRQSEKLIPIIRAGLALQRLEKSLSNEAMQFDVYRMPDGMHVELHTVDRDGSRRRSTGDSNTLTDAINAALDAAGSD